MEYGPVTQKHLAELNSGEVFQDSVQWRADDFTLAFPDRLIEMVSEYQNLPTDRFEAEKTVRRIVTEGCTEKNIEFSRTTLTEWLEGERDPGVTGSEDNTRENIYKFAAALDFDYELTTELFEKVFFTRAFNPKNMREVCYFYFANRDFKKGDTGADWYNTGSRTFKKLQADISNAFSETKAVESTLIIDAADAMNELEFIEFLQENAITFSKDNQCMAAKNKVREYAEECCDSENIPYDSLITEIIGYSQRGSENASIASVRSLPAQLTANFPSGQILRAICLNEENGYDKIYKMLVLLLFYAFHRNSSSRVESRSRFLDFISFANLELENVGFVDLYPKQPYCGFILFCAAQAEPIKALQNYIGKTMEDEVRKNLFRKLRQAYPKESKDVVQKAADRIDGNFFIVDMVIRNRMMIAPNEISNDYESVLQIIYDRSGFTEKQKELLRYLTLLPADGISDSLFAELFDAHKENVSFLSDKGWITGKGKKIMIDYRCRTAVFNADLTSFPRWSNCSEFVNLLTEKLKSCADSREEKQILAMLRRASHLDGIPKEEKAKLLPAKTTG